MKAEEKTVPINQVRIWETNLKIRATSKEGYRRTKAQIDKLGIYKRLICYYENGLYHVLGGRTRFHILMKRGDREVDIAIVKPKDEAEKLEYCMSDNDHSGDWIETELLETAYPHIEKIELKDYNISLGKTTKLRKLIDGVGPEKKKFGKLEMTEEIECPECGHTWIK